MIKWKFYADGGAKEDLLKAHPELEDLDEECGFCEYQHRHDVDGCGECPLAENGGCCGTAWVKWCGNPTRKNAQAVYDYIEEHG